MHASTASSTAASVAAESLAKAGNSGGLEGADLSRFSWGCARLAGGATVPSAAGWAGAAQASLAELPPPEAVSLLWALAQLACETEPGFLADALASVPPEALDAPRLQVALESVRALVGEDGPLSAVDRASVSAWSAACDRAVPLFFESGLESGSATAL